jgi:uncharacterized membrane protein
MMGAVVPFAVALAGFLVLDGLWLGVVMGSFYRTQLGPIARLSGGGFAPLWWAAGLVYVLLAAGIAGLVVPRAATPAAALAWGALFGLVVYGVYDLTNLATLRAWPPLLTVVDIAWGTTACACAAWLTVTVLRWWR